MKKLSRFYLYTACIMLGLLSVASVFAARDVNPKPNQECIIPKLDLEKVPFPGKSANTKFDLAEGQIYLLKGRIITRDNGIYFLLDLESQPWLATAARVTDSAIMVDPADAILLKSYMSMFVFDLVVEYKKMGDSVGPCIAKETMGLKVVVPPSEMHL